MAAPGIGNPVGAVQVDSFDPLAFTFVARTNISGGAFVFASGANNILSSGTSSFTTGSLLVATDASGGNFTGIAMMNTGSNTACTVALQGIFLLQANGTILAGNGVNCDGNNAVLPVGSETITAFTTSKLIGRALSSAASGGYCAVFVRG